MQTKKYRVECVDRDTGDKSLHVFEGVNEKAASDLANRMGFLVGSVLEVREEHRPAFPWGVALTSLVVGVAIGAGGLFAVVSAGRMSVPSKVASPVPALVVAEPTASKPIERTPSHATPIPANPPKPIVTEIRPIETPDARTPIAAAPITSGIQNRPLAVRREYDRFADKTLVYATLQLTDEGGETLDISLLESANGNVQTVQSLIGTQLSIRASAPWSDHELVMLVHSKGRVSRIRLTTKWGGADMHYAYLAREQIREVAAADKVEVDWWTYQGTLTNESMRRLREFVRFLR